MRQTFNAKIFHPFHPRTAPSCSSIHRTWCWRFPWAIRSNYLLRFHSSNVKSEHFSFNSRCPHRKIQMVCRNEFEMVCGARWATKHRLCERFTTSHSLAAVSSMLFDCGGLLFPGCAFSGWYMSTGTFELPISSHGAWFSHFPSLNHLKSNRNRVPKPLRH